MEGGIAMRKLSAAIAAAVALAASCVSAQAPPPTEDPAAPGADQLACTTEFLKRWKLVADHVENLGRRSRDSERSWLCSYARTIVGWQDDLINFAQSDAASCGIGAWYVGQMTAYRYQMLVWWRSICPCPWRVERAGLECKFSRL